MCIIGSCVGKFKSLGVELLDLVFSKRINTFQEENEGESALGNVVPICTRPSQLKPFTDYVTN